MAGFNFLARPIGGISSAFMCIQVQRKMIKLMQWLNRRPDRTHFNFFFSNCADFTRQMLDVLFPGAIHRNFLFDLGMTTPKQLESSLHHYAARHPELQFGLPSCRKCLGVSRGVGIFTG